MRLVFLAVAAASLASGCVFPLPPLVDPCADGGSSPSCPPPPLTVVVRINAGGPAVGDFEADRSFTDGVPYGSPEPIALDGVEAPAPEAVYQDYRYSPPVTLTFRYTLADLPLDTPHVLRLHFADMYNSQPNARRFHVDVNGARRLDAYDVIGRAGGRARAIVEELDVMPDSAGTLDVLFTGIPGFDTAELSGLELLR